MKRIPKLQINTKKVLKMFVCITKSLTQMLITLSKQLCANKSYNTAQEDFVDKL